MLLQAFVIACCTLYCIWLYRKYQRVWKHIAKFRGPFALPIFGNVLQVGNTPEQYLALGCQFIKKYNYDIFRVYGGPQPYVVISDPKHIEMILSSTHLIFKEDLYRFFQPWLGSGLLTANGLEWAKHRKMITPSFHFQILQDFFHVMNDASYRFMRLLDTYAEKGEIFDFQGVITRYTIDVICESAMGIKVNNIEGEPSPVVSAIDELCDIIQERIFSVFGRIEMFFRLTKDYRRQNAALKVLRQEISKIIDNRRKILMDKKFEEQTSDNFKRPKKAFLDNLLTAEIDGRPLTFKEIFDEVSTFMFEGHDTTASALGFTTFCLSRHPNIQDKVLKEQQEIFGDDMDRYPTFQELSEMKYLEMVIKEVLRLFPSVPFISRDTTEDTMFGEYMIPAGTSFLICSFALARNEKNFKDAFEFRPERFAPDERVSANPFDNVPFSAGPRNCIGQKFAMMELKLTMSKIIRNFKILPPVEGLSSGIYDLGDPLYKPKSPYDPRLVVLMTLKSCNGLQIRLSKRHY